MCRCTAAGGSSGCPPTTSTLSLRFCAAAGRASSGSASESDGASSFVVDWIDRERAKFERLRTNQSLRWSRVHNLPDFVFFNHSIHINKGVGCSTCHGRVDLMPLTWRTSTLLMEWCLECHRAPEKFIRPREQVFNMRYEQPTSNKVVTVGDAKFDNQIALGRALIKQYNVRPRCALSRSASSSK